MNMTDSEKAKAYDKILERAKKMHGENIDACKACIEELFPELAESADEKTRKEITSFFKNFSETGTWKAIADVAKWIAWLEKQGEQKPTEWSEEDKRILNSVIQAAENHCFINLQERNWLKSLKDRVQPKQEWKESLTTADLENSLCDIQDGFSDTSYEYRILGEAIEFIRCTESKPQWKPSDEQILM